jgi:hypothetical protein
MRGYRGAIGGTEVLLAGRGLPLNEPIGAKGAEPLCEGPTGSPST